MGQCLDFRCVVFLFQAEDGIRDWSVTGVQTCALPISAPQLRRRPAQRPVRDPVPWRLLLRGLLRTSAGSADLDRSHEIDREIAHGCEGIKPGWARVSLNYFISAAVSSCIMQTVRLVAKDGWCLLGDNRFDPPRAMASLPG